eukprot:Platyproteum_vivax@DN4739_c0_g2_i1.p1
MADNHQPKSATELLAKILQKKAQFYCQLAEEISHDAGIAWSASAATKQTPKRKASQAVKDPLAPKKPLTSYFVFSNDMRHEAKEKNKQIPTAKEISEMWKALKPEKRAKYEEKFKKSMAEFDLKMTAYTAKKSSTTVEVPSIVKTPVEEESETEESDEESEEEEETVMLSAKKRKSFEKGPEVTTPKVPKKKKVEE